MRNEPFSAVDGLFVFKRFLARICRALIQRDSAPFCRNDCAWVVLRNGACSAISPGRNLSRRL
jgi:hypothetical protein